MVQLEGGGYSISKALVATAHLFAFGAVAGAGAWSVHFVHEKYGWMTDGNWLWLAIPWACVAVVFFAFGVADFLIPD